MSKFKVLDIVRDMQGRLAVVRQVTGRKHQKVAIAFQVIYGETRHEAWYEAHELEIIGNVYDIFGKDA